MTVITKKMIDALPRNRDMPPYVKQRFESFRNISLAKKIERWANLQRVLENLSEHDRIHHFCMTIWGAHTECGTVACAAGHAAMDPWFRKQGLRLVFIKRFGVFNDPKNPRGYVPNVHQFFGYYGTDTILTNANPRSVETVIEEIKNYIIRLPDGKRHE